VSIRAADWSYPGHITIKAEMTLTIVRQRLDSLLRDPRTKVLLLTGAWGTGKTYQWKQAMQRASTDGFHPRYAYVSLFGLNGLSEVRRRIAEETAATIRLPSGSGTIGDAIADGGWRLKPLQIMKLLPVIPYLGKLEGLANELSFSFVRDAVVCFDDLERAAENLRLAEVLGLASFLKEERGCKVILISDRDKLSQLAQEDLGRYLEKVVDEFVHFAPSPDEACDIALGESGDSASFRLRQKLTDLGISNIRVISRLREMLVDLKATFACLHELAFKEAIDALVLFGAAHLLPDDGFPTVEYLMDYRGAWMRHLRSAKEAKDQTPEELQHIKWEEMLDRYGYGETMAIDIEIGVAVQQGFFDSEKIRRLGQERSANLGANDRHSTYSNTWEKFWHSIEGNGEEQLELLREATLNAIDIIGPSDIQTAFTVFSDAGKVTVANELLERFIAANQNRPGVFDQVDGAFGGSYSGEVAARLRAEAERLRDAPLIEEAIDRIDLNRGWSADDVMTVTGATSDDIERLLRVSEGRPFRARLRVLLRLGSLSQGSEEGTRVEKQTFEFLKRLAADDPIIGIRMRQYLPVDQIMEPVASSSGASRQSAESSREVAGPAPPSPE
jgi:hypothetical protein